MESKISERLPLVAFVVDVLVRLLVVQPGHSPPVGWDEGDDIAEENGAEAGHHQAQVPQSCLHRLFWDL